MIFNAVHRLLLFFVALVAGLTMTHVLQSPGSRGLSGEQWLAVQHTFYGGFALVGGVAEVGGVIAAALLLVLGRRRWQTVLPAMICMVALLGCLAAFVFGNNPANQAINSWTPSTLPADWASTRNAWERAHAISAGLSLIALVSMIVASRPRSTPQS